VFYHEALGGRDVPRAVLFDLEPGVIGAVILNHRGELFSPHHLVNHTRGQNWAKGNYKRVEHQFS
jgi:tubulin beta